MEEEDEDDDNTVVGKTFKGRGNPFEPSTLMANLIFAWGCAPSKVVILDTRMVNSFFDTLRDRFCR